jgi:hypothetical protein
VIGFWDEKADEAEVLAAAVREDRFAWNPQYDPESRLSHSHRTAPAKTEWTIRVHEGDALLWEKTLRGLKSERYMSWGFIPTRSWAPGPDETDDGGPFLHAESAQSLPAENEYDLPAGKYYVKHAFEAHTGRKAATWVCVFQEGNVERVFRRYDKQGRLRREERSDFLREGGLAAGSDQEAWLRKIVRTFDPQTGEVLPEEVFRHGQDEHGASAWIKVP